MCQLVLYAQSHLSLSLLVVLLRQNGPYPCGVYFSTLLEEHTSNELCILKLNTNYLMYAYHD
jgi:hypothetical protein